MTSPLWPSGFDRSEVIPPVPAPRYKRKLITNEDSKHSSDKQNTSVNERTTEILPPPRRKHKPPRTQKTNTLIPRNNDKYENKKNELLEDVQIITPISNGEISPICNKIGPETDACDYKNFPCKPNHLNEKKTSNTSEMTDAFREIVDSSILKNFINNRVLDIPPLGSIQNPSYICVEQKLSTQDSDVDHSEENRVNSGLSENSATIVGVFYKPEYSLIKQMSENKLVNSNSNMNGSNELEPTVWSSSFVDDGNKKTVVPPESMRIGNKMNKKDSEEDDSGVYFSDTKSPPHRNNDAEITDRNTNGEIDASSDLQFFKPLTCNDRDTFDNNSSDVGPNMYNEMLDCFEALTVNALREEVTGRLSLCSELSKNKVVENWLDNGEYLSKKKVINSNLSEYLKNMLEVDESERSLSPYPLSTVDESSDISERGFNEEIECGRQSLSLEACTVPSSPSETRENRNVDCRDKYLSSFVYTNGVNNVYNGCTEVTQCKIKSISVSESPVSSIEDVERVCNVGDVMVSSGNSISQPSFFFKETNLPASASPSIENGAVNKLITFFETIHTEEDLDKGMESEYENGISDAIEDVDEDSLLSSDNFGSVGKSNDGEEYTEGHFVKNSPVCFTEQYETSPLETNNGEIESCSNECFIEEKMLSKNLTDINCTSEFELEPSFKYDFKGLELDESKINYEKDFEDIPTSQLIGKVKEQFVIPAEMKLVSDDSDTITTLDFCKNPPIDICDDIIDSASIIHVNQIEQDIKELSPPTEFADDKEVQVIFDRNRVTEINRESYDSTVPNFNISTKDVMESDDTFCPFKPTRIPIVILTEADITSVPIGSIELHPAESLPKDKDTEGTRSDLHSGNCVTDVTNVGSNEVNDKDGEEDCLENAVTVVLEKNWGSIGLKIKGDGHGVVVSDILAGGAADQSGLVFQGLSPEKGLQEYGYSLKSAPCWKILNINLFVILFLTI